MKGGPARHRRGSVAPDRRLVGLLLCLLLIFAVPVSEGADDRERRDLVDQARITLDNFLADSNMTWFRDHVKEAKGLFIVPQFLKAAFFFDGAGGSGVFVARDERTGDWSEPAFFTMGAGSFGFQFGAQASEVVPLVLTQRGVDSLLLGNFKLGAGAAGATTPNFSADLLSFVRAKGLFAGVSLEGAVLAARDEWSTAYYGKPVSPADIVIRREVKNSHPGGLRAVILKAMGRP